MSEEEWARKEAGGGYERLCSQWLSPLNTPGGSPVVMERSRSHCQTAKNIQSAATTFERWLASKEKSNRRPMEQIPPAELDRYLSDFFSTVKKRSGQDYNSDTLLSLRSYIDRYLREKGYPCSITKSDVFANSQMAFKVRRQELAGGGAYLRSPSLGYLTNGIPVSPNMLGANKHGGISVAINSAGHCAAGNISNVSRNSLPDRVTSPDAESLLEGNAISPMNNSDPPPSSQHTSENTTNVGSCSEVDSGKSPMATSHAEPSQSGAVDETNATDSTGVVAATDSVYSKKRSAGSSRASKSPSPETPSPEDGVHAQPFRALSDCSQSSPNTETPPSPISFFSDLPRIPQTLTKELQEDQQ